MDATEAWITDLGRVLGQGRRVSPRGQLTMEMVGFASTPVDMSRPVLTSPARKLGYKFMAAEAAWILSGDDKVATISPFSKDIANFSDDGVKFAGAYGPKIKAQLKYVVDCLVKDLDTRQAVLTIWREKPKPSKDVPCTVAVQFLAREGKLYCVDTMRSSDLWLGHPYDVFNFSMLSLGVILMLRERNVDLELGELYLNAGSKHVYDRNMDGVKAVLDEFTDLKNDMKPHDPGPVVDTRDFSSYDDLVQKLWTMAREGTVREQSSWGA